MQHSYGQLSVATHKLRKMTIQDESQSMCHPIQMPKTPYIRYLTFL